MEKEFAPYQESLELKELEFDEPCLGLYKEDSSFLYADVFSFREPYSPSEFKEGVDEGVCYINSEILEELVTAPTFSQAFRWFREKYGLKHDIDDDNVGTKFYYRIKSYTNKFDNYDDIIKPMREEKDWAKIEFKTYEEAELACLRKLIEIVKKK